MSELDDMMKKLGDLHGIKDRTLYYRRDGTPYPNGMEGMLQWGKDLEMTDRRVDKTNLWWGGYVSTVWLGLDHGWGAGPPLIFETMVFGKVSMLDLDMERYSYESEAIMGHHRLVRKWSNPWTLLVYWTVGTIRRLKRWVHQ